MFDRILDEGLKGENGDAEGQSGGVDVEFGTEVVTEAELLDFEVGANDGEFLFEGDEGVVVAEEVAEDIGEIEDGLAGARGRGGDDAVEGIQSVEEEVRVDLGLEGAEFGLGEESGAFGLAGMLEAFGNELGELGEFGVVFREVAAAAGARSEKEESIGAEGDGGGFRFGSGSGIGGVGRPVPGGGVEVGGDEGGCGVEELVFGIEAGGAEGGGGGIEGSAAKDEAGEDLLGVMAGDGEEDEEEAGGSGGEGEVAWVAGEDGSGPTGEDGGFPGSEGEEAGEEEVGEETEEGVEEEEAVVLGEDEETEGDAGVVEGEFEGPCGLCAFFMEVGEGQREQDEDHGGEAAAGRAGIGEPAEEREEGEAGGSEEESGAVDGQVREGGFGGMKECGDGAEGIASENDGPGAAIEAEIEQEGGEKAESAHGGDGQGRASKIRPGERKERGGVPEEGESGGGAGDASGAGGVAAAAMEKDEEDGEDDGAGEMAEEVNEEGFVGGEAVHGVSVGRVSWGGGPGEAVMNGVPFGGARGKDEGDPVEAALVEFVEGGVEGGGVGAGGGGESGAGGEGDAASGGRGLAFFEEEERGGGGVVAGVETGAWVCAAGGGGGGEVDRADVGFDFLAGDGAGAEKEGARAGEGEDCGFDADDGGTSVKDHVDGIAEAGTDVFGASGRESGEAVG